jgi:hypothetical protein
MSKHTRIRGTVVAGLAAALATVVVGSALAANVVGTAKNDVLRGTAQADKLVGRGGNDKLYGLAGNDSLMGGPGNDVLVGGPGGDRFFCGSGRDTAVAERSERVAKGCEVVRRTPTAPAPQPPAPPPPPPPPPPSPPAPPIALLGKYCGFTDSGGGICFELGQASAIQYVTNANFEQTTDCEPDARFRLTITFGGRVPLTSSLTFSYLVGGGELADSRIDGSVDGQGNARGSLVMKASFDYEGAHYTCESTTNWTATLGR